MTLIPDEDYFIENGLLVMTATYHLKRGYCCGSSCRYCPFYPVHLAGATIFREGIGPTIVDNELQDTVPPKTSAEYK